MKKRFSNSYELANYFLSNKIHPRRWGGTLDGFIRSNSYKAYMDCNYYSPEYSILQEKAISDFINYINERLTFPLFYKCEFMDSDGPCSYFKVTYTTDNQLSFDMTMV